MIKGNVYTVGSPQYLTQKFGTEFKIDVMLKDDEDAKDKVDKFFETKLPDAVLSIQRPKARIYSIDANIITLPKLFKTMQTGSDGDNGFNYFTCTSSSLERVFMEIVHMSEGNDAEMKNHEDVQQSKSNSTDSESTEGTDNKLETLESDKEKSPSNDEKSTTKSSSDNDEKSTTKSSSDNDDESTTNSSSDN